MQCSKFQGHWPSVQEYFKSVHAGSFCMLLLLSADFFLKLTFKKFFQKHNHKSANQTVPTLWSPISVN